jgi:hypothetical protein
MAIPKFDFWYDGQQRRFLEQIVLAFSGFSYDPGFRKGVQQPPRLVPCRMSTRDSMVGYVMRNLSENSINAVPMIAVSQIGLVGRRNGLQNPTLVEHIHVNERQVVDGQYTNKAGNNYTVDRIMPRPFEMRFQVDIWTSNLNQKYQLAEQILPIVFPYFDIQNGTNGVDWTAKTTVEIDEDIQFSSKTIPVGTDNSLDIMTITGRLPIWLSVPAKVTPQKLIREVITNIYDGGYVDDCGLAPGGLLRRVIVTPDDAQISVDNDEITLLNGKGGLYNNVGGVPNFAEYLGQFGTYSSGTSTIGIATQFGGPYVNGILSDDPSNPNKLFWQIDPATLPVNTMPAIAEVINPLRSVCAPNDSATLPAPAIGVRYLITANIAPSVAWPNLTAYENDIIQYTSNGWIVIFQSRVIKTQQYVVNNGTMKQLFWNGEQWSLSIDGVYAAGYWNATVDILSTDSTYNADIEEAGNVGDSLNTGYDVEVDEFGDAEDMESPSYDVSVGESGDAKDSDNS